jgi:arabinofuranosyltransferase
MGRGVREGQLGILLLGIALAYAGLTLWSAPSWTVDDAYILFRYATNWARLGIPTWNPGEPPVEGYTGTLLLALLTAGIHIGIPPELSAKVVGIAAYFGAGLVLWRFLTELEVRAGVRAAAILLYYTLADLFPHALSGLETTLFLALLLTATWCTVRFQRRQHLRELLGAALALGALAMVRPEGVLLSALLIGALLWSSYTGAVPWRWTLALAVLVLLPLGAVTLWRWSVYGALLPNTYWAKLGSSFTAHAVRSLVEFAALSWAAAWVAALMLALPEWEESRAWLRRFRPLLPIGVALGVGMAVVLLSYSRSELTMNYAHRFWVPFYPLGLLGAALLAESGRRTIRPEARPERARAVSAVVLSLIGVQCIAQVALWRWEGRKFLRDYEQLLREEHTAAAELLRRLLPADAWIVVYPDAGLIPYRTGLRTLDFGRLTDAFLARHRWSGSARDTLILAYVFRHAPAAFVFKSRCRDRVCLTAEADAVCSDPRFAQYELVRVFDTRARTYAHSYFLHVYVHRRFLPQASFSPQ